MKIFRAIALIAGLLSCSVSSATAQCFGDPFEGAIVIPPNMAQLEEQYAPVLAEIRPLAENGDPEAQTRLGNILGFLGNDEEGASWHLRAAQQGYAAAQHSMAYNYETGRGVPLDPERRMYWLRLAADQGYTLSMIQLGEAYLQGEGVPLDNREAVYWFRLCAEEGDWVCHSQLGFMYEHGTGVPMDFVLAYMWYNLAAANEHSLSPPCRDAISQRMSQTQIAEAQALSSRCFEQNYQNCGR